MFWKLTCLDCHRDACQGEQILNRRWRKRGRRLPALTSAQPLLEVLYWGYRTPCVTGVAALNMCMQGHTVTKAWRQREFKVSYISVITFIIVNYPSTSFQFSNHR